MHGLLANSITLRPARAADIGFVWPVYADGIGPYLSGYRAWNEGEEAVRFRRIYDPVHSAIVLCDCVDAGWLTVVHHDSAILLQQFFIAAAFRGRGLGTELLSRLCAEWDGMDRPVALAVLKNNPAQTLYARFGFTTYWQNDDRYFMLRTPG
ncbi:GNAT family N-acetyltransferase [Ferrovibrio sp.]|uniref:GNAT family N-acetyltransferase n=1 Tax=Ferrovibrio sp. TaxID=1917215 RepID=UPI0026305649|nr:GNAT family N-acetyltransferase [Ferrovibrio sp.]